MLPNKPLKRRRATRSLVAAFLAFFAITVLVSQARPFGEGLFSTWPVWRRVVFGGLAGASVAAGWEPAVAMWRGEDQRQYVTEPEVDDEFEL